MLYDVWGGTHYSSAQHMSVWFSTLGPGRRLCTRDGQVGVVTRTRSAVDIEQC